MSNREKQLEIVLTQLLTQHFFTKDLEWGWQEGVSLKDRDLELYLQIANLVPQVILAQGQGDEE